MIKHCEPRHSHGASFATARGIRLVDPNQAPLPPREVATKQVPLWLWFVFSAFLFTQTTAAAPPNIVVVLADDLGYGDLGCYWQPRTRTPNIDRFAAEGLRLTDCYAAHPNCSPSQSRLDDRTDAVSRGDLQLDPDVFADACQTIGDHRRHVAARCGLRHLPRGKMASQRRLQSAQPAAAVRSRIQSLVHHSKQRVAQSSQPRQLRSKWRTSRPAARLFGAVGGSRSERLAAQSVATRKSRSFCLPAFTNRTNRSPRTAEFTDLYQSDDPSCSLITETSRSWMPDSRRFWRNWMS